MASAPAGQRHRVPARRAELGRRVGRRVLGQIATMKNLGHRVGRSTIARILLTHGIPPRRERAIAWKTFVRAHWPALIAADFFTIRGVDDARLGHLLHCVCHRTAFAPCSFARQNALSGRGFVIQTLRPLAGHGTGPVRNGRILICDRDPKWSRAAEQFLAMAGVRIVRTPARAPNCNAYAERFMRSIKEECLNRIVPPGERHLRRALAEYVAHSFVC